MRTIKTYSKRAPFYNALISSCPRFQAKFEKTVTSVTHIIFRDWVSAFIRAAEHCKLGTPRRGFCHEGNHFSQSSPWLSLLRRQTILPFEKERRQGMVPSPPAVSKPVSLRDLRWAVFSL